MYMFMYYIMYSHNIISMLVYSMNTVCSLVPWGRGGEGGKKDCCLGNIPLSHPLYETMGIYMYMYMYITVEPLNNRHIRSRNCFLRRAIPLNESIEGCSLQELDSAILCGHIQNQLNDRINES